MRQIGSMILGGLLALAGFPVYDFNGGGFPVYDFNGGGFSLVNTLILLGLAALWVLLCNKLQERK